MLAFFIGMLVSALVVEAADLSHRYYESRRRQLIARIRGTAIPRWPDEAGAGA